MGEGCPKVSAQILPDKVSFLWFFLFFFRKKRKNILPLHRSVQRRVRPVRRTARKSPR